MWLKKNLGAGKTCAVFLATHKTITNNAIPTDCTKFSFFVDPSIPYPSSYHPTSPWASWSFQFRFWFHKWYIILKMDKRIGQRIREISALLNFSIIQKRFTTVIMSMSNNRHLIGFWTLYVTILALFLVLILYEHLGNERNNCKYLPCRDIVMIIIYRRSIYSVLWNPYCFWFVQFCL